MKCVKNCLKLYEKIVTNTLQKKKLKGGDKKLIIKIMV